MVYERKRVRSDSFQYLFCEISVSSDILNIFLNEESLANRLSNGFSYDERVLDLTDQLNEVFWALSKKVLTEKQYRILILIRAGKTQHEISKIVKINQASVNKTLNGNQYKAKNGQIKLQGGIIHKLQKVIKENQEIINILAKIKEII